MILSGKFMVRAKTMRQHYTIRNIMNTSPGFCHYFLKYFLCVFIKVFPGLITLRKICNHPDISTGGPSQFDPNFNPEKNECKYGYFKRSGKMIVVDSLLKLWQKQGHRVLLFTQSKQVIVSYMFQ